MAQILADGMDAVSRAVAVERANRHSGGHTPFDEGKL
jgi:hypothetical protein